MRPEVTIGVCVRDCQDFVKEALESITSQDYPHELTELIFVDDGSEDQTLSHIETYISEVGFRARLFHTSWKGLGYARKIVATNAEGEFVLWVDGDMVIPKDYVRKLVQFMDEHPEVGIAKGRQALQLASNLLGTLESYSRAAGRMVDYQSKGASAKSLGTGGSIYRVEAIRQAGGFDESLRGYGEDFDLEIRVRRAGWSLSAVDAEFLDYERHGLTWRDLWGKYYVRGYFTHYFLHKNEGYVKPYRMLPPSAFLHGFFHAKRLFGLTHRKAVYLLPFLHIFKMTSWNVGFIRSHLAQYEPKS